MVHFTILCLQIVYGTAWQNWLMMNWQGCHGSVECYIPICLKGLRKMIKILSQNSNEAPPEYMSACANTIYYTIIKLAVTHIHLSLI
jgi:hypothetical protein